MTASGTMPSRAARHAVSDMPDIITVFNNKGGVGKTTLVYHLGHALAESGKRVLLVDADPQCNLTIYGLEVEKIHDLWTQEDAFIDAPGYAEARAKIDPAEFEALNGSPRTLHYLLKPAEEGTDPLPKLPPPFQLAKNLDIVPGRLTMHMYEDTIARRWSEAFVGGSLALRTITEVRRLVDRYVAQEGYDIAIVDTSPSLGLLNKVILSTVDHFLIPCNPDLFSVYGVRNIGNSISDSCFALMLPSIRRNSGTEGGWGWAGISP